MTRVILFGSCLLRSPFHTARRSAAAALSEATRDDIVFSGVPFFTRTLGEAVQAIEFYQGKRYLWPEIKSLCGIDPNFKPNTKIGINHGDVFLFEPQPYPEIIFQDFHLNIAKVQQFLRSMKVKDPATGRMFERWFQHLTEADSADEVAKIAGLIARRLPKAFPDDGFLEAFVRTTVARESSIRDGLRRLQSMVHKPIGVVGRTDRFGADGHPTPESARFSQEVADVCLDLSLPLFDPTPVIQSVGVKQALRPDLRHYTAEFNPTIAQPLLAFARSLAGTA